MKKEALGILLAVTILSTAWWSAALAEEVPFYGQTSPQEVFETEEHQDPEPVTDPSAEWFEEESGFEPEEERDPEPAINQEESSEPDQPESFSVHVSDDVQPEEVPEEFSEENGFTIFSEENADLLSAENDPDGQNLIEEIQNGEMIGLASIFTEPDMAEEDETDPGVARAAASSAQYRMEVKETLAPDEVTKQMQYREIVYTDGNGKRRTAPIYCLNASKEGISTQDLKEEAVRTLKNATIRKLLYFGYGGPGDISDSYDPTCQHVRWSRWENRYVFTHMALSKVYSREYGRSSEEECEHVGVNRYLEKIKGLTIPARDGIVFQTKDASGNLTAQKKQTVFFGNGKAGTTDHTWDWVNVSEPGFSQGFMVSELVQMIDTGNAGNTITISRDANAVWQLGYWKNEAEYSSRGDKNPRILGKEKSLTVKSGYLFRIIMPQTFEKKETWKFTMSLNPVTFLFVDGSAQTGDDVQDFGTYVYQGTASTASLTLVPDVLGNVFLIKKDIRTDAVVSGASYGLYAAEKVSSRTTGIFSKNESVAEGVTDGEGQIIFFSVPPGKYVAKEIAASPGYLLDTKETAVSVAAGNQWIAVTEIPDLRGRVSIRKIDKKTGEDLEGAVFTLGTWSRTQQSYTYGTSLVYDAASKRYVSDVFHYSPENQGKFQIKETENPKGYTGSFTMDLTLDELSAGEEKLFEYCVENTEVLLPHIEIRKIDADSGKNLPDAEFTLYEWDEEQKQYLENGSGLIYDPKNEKYVSKDLEITETNQGKFKLLETKVPEGYTGSWEKEVLLDGEKQVLSFTVKNQRMQPPKGKVQIIKRDALSKEELDGAEFQIYPWNNGEKAYRKTVDDTIAVTWSPDSKCYESAELFLTEENQGRFLVCEIKNPAGYTGEWSEEVRLTQEGQILTLTAENTPLTGEITIKKKIRSADITWAHGTPAFFFTVTGKDLYGHSHTYEAEVSFVCDGFAVDAEGYGTVQVTISHVPLGEYQIYEKPVLRYYLKDAIANTGNVSISRGGASGYGSDPKQIAWGTARLSPDAPGASITFINEKSRYDGYSHNSSIKNTIPITFE